MPSKTEKQARFFRAIAHGFRPKHRKAPSIAVAKEFMAADQNKKRRRTIAEGSK
jgi:DNA-binding cell septation regulator SpoVG